MDAFFIRAAGSTYFACAGTQSTRLTMAFVMLRILEAVGDERHSPESRTPFRVVAHFKCRQLQQPQPSELSSFVPIGVRGLDVVVATGVDDCAILGRSQSEWFDSARERRPSPLSTCQTELRTTETESTRPPYRGSHSINHGCHEQ
jgi:hypothetical protein